ncbi:MAG: hypothetical protein JNJ45_05765 [Chthonomonas sp.]|nr:hypothetical protein [Chthonomonas sp.]
MAKGQFREALQYVVQVIENEGRASVQTPWRMTFAFELGDFDEAKFRNNEPWMIRRAQNPEFVLSELDRMKRDCYDMLVHAEATRETIDWEDFRQTHSDELSVSMLLQIWVDVAVQEFRFRFAERALAEYERVTDPRIRKDLRTKLSQRKELQRRIVRGEAEVPDF